MLKKLSFLLFPILLLIFLSNRIFFFTPTILETTASCLAYPAIKLSSTIAKPIRKFFKKRHSYNKLFKHYKQLSQERDRLLQESITLKASLAYLQKSSDLREFKNRYKLENAILSTVLIKTLTAQEHSIIVNRGSWAGVKEDMVAIYKFQLIGRVSQVYPWYSKITLITDRHSKISAHTNTSDARGIVEGNNTVNRCRLRYISHLNPVHNNDLVFSSGQGLVFPQGFCLGKIINIKTEDICHYVEVEPLVDFRSLEMCYLTNQSKMNLF